jgi:hypothetical protein
MSVCALLLVAVSIHGAPPLSCGACQLLQEGIHRSIATNITAMEKDAVAGTMSTATLQVGQVIWHLCASDAWAGQRYDDALGKVCRTAVEKHVDALTTHWKEREADEYKDPAIALRMKRSVCGGAELSACRAEDLASISDFELVRPDECDVCKALVHDLYGLVMLSRERPTSAKHDNYFRLIGVLGQACADLPMRHAMRPDQKQTVLDICEDLWDEHEAPLSKLALKWGDREGAYAQSLCSSVLDVCAEDAPLNLRLFAADIERIHPRRAHKEDL